MLILSDPNIRIDSLPLPKEAIDFYASSGIEELYPPQSEIVRKGLMEGNNILAAIPTACGKTLIAELAMLKHVLNGGKALYIVPLIALANEKGDRFAEFEFLGIKTSIATGEYESKSETLGKSDIIVCTSEKVDSMLRNGTSWLQEISIVVVDEIHILGDNSRGPTLDTVITTLNKIPDLQIVALSATIGNAEVLAKWLNAELISSEWRPTTLHEGVAIDSTMNFFTGCTPFSENIEHQTKDLAANIVLDTVSQEAQCLVFESSRRNCAGFAKKFSNPKNKEHKAMNLLLSDESKKELANIAEDIELSSNTSDAKVLADCIRNGAAFHHAGLNSTQRRLVESGFKNNHIKFISCTPTLAAGLNLPARKVIIRNYTRYHPDFGSIPIPVLDYKQMVGRAGRPHLDPKGYSLLLVKEESDIEILKEKFIFANAEDIESLLRDESILRAHVLGLICRSSSISQGGIIDFFSGTFSAFTGDLIDFTENICFCIEFLQNHDMITINDGLLSPTALGSLISRMYINPLSAAIITESLNVAENENMELTELSLLHLLCNSEGFRRIYIKSTEIEMYEYIASEVENEIIGALDPETASDYDYEMYLESLKNAMILKDWINEVDTQTITDNYSIGEGDLHSLTESASWIAYALKRIAALREQDINYNGLDSRLKYGAGKDLVNLLSIKNIGRKRARLLFDSNIRSIETLCSSPFEIVSSLIGNKITRKIFDQLSLPVPAEIEIPKEEVVTVSEPQNMQKSLFDF
jgi:helicase